MKAWVWIIIASAGFAVMLAAYATRERVDSEAPWSSGLIVISREASAEKVGRAGAIAARLRLLSSSDVAEMLLFLTGDLVPDKALGVKGQVRVKLIGLPLAMVGVGADWLESGRLPEAGRNEVLAGAKIEPSDTLLVGGQTLKVVGTLKPGLALFATSYLIPSEDIATDATKKLFPTEVPTVFHAWLVPNSAEELRDPKVRKELEETFPPKRFAWVTAEERLEPRAFYLYLSGLAIFFVGGSGALIGLFRWLAGKVTSPFLAAPLLEMKARPWLVWGVHLLFYGLVIAGSLLTYEAAGRPSRTTGQSSRGTCDEEQSARHRGRGLLQRKYPRRRGCHVRDQFSAVVAGRDYSAVGPGAGQRCPRGGHPRRRVGRDTGPGHGVAGLCDVAVLGNDASGRRRLHPCHALRPAGPDSRRPAQAGR